MAYYVTALTNDRARLIVDEMRCSCEATADMVAQLWEDRGHIIVRRSEG